MAEDMKAQVTVSIEDKLSQPLKDMVKVVELMDKSVRAMGDQFGSLADTLLNAAGEFTALLTPIQDAEDSVSALGDTMHGLRIHIKDVEDRLKASENAYSKAERRIDKLEAQIAELNAAMQNLTESHEQANGRIQELTGQMEEMREEQERVAEAAREAEEAERSFQARLEKLQSVGEGMMKFGAALAAPAAGLSALATKAVNTYAEVQKGEVRFRNTFEVSKNPKADEARMQEAVALAEKLGVSLPGSTSDMLDMFSALREQGVTMEQVLHGTGEAAANFATVMGVGFEQSAVMMSKFSEALDMPADQATELVDILQRLKGASGLTVDDLYGTFSYLGSTLKTLKVGGKDAAKEISALLTIMGGAGIEGSRAGTGLAGAMSAMANVKEKINSKGFQEKFGREFAVKGIELSFFNKSGQFVGTKKMFTELQKLKRLDDQKQLQVLTELFGEASARPMAALVAAGEKGYNEAVKKMEMQKDTQTKIKEIMGTISMSWESLQGTIDTLWAAVGKHINQAFGKDGIAGVINKVNDFISGNIIGWINAHPKEVQEIVKSFAEIPKLLTPLWDKLKEIGAWFKDPKTGEWIKENNQKFADMLKIAAKLIGAGAVIGPVIAAVGTGLTTAATLCGVLAAKGTGLLKAFGLDRGLWRAWGAELNTLLADAGDAFLTWFSRVDSRATAKVASWIAGIGNKIGGVWSRFAGSSFGQFATGFGRFVADDISSGLSAAKSSVSGWLTGLGRWISNSPVGRFFGWIGRGLGRLGGLLGRGIGRFTPWLSRFSGVLSRFPLLSRGLSALAGGFLRANIAGIAFTVVLELIKRHWEEIKAFFKGFADGFLSQWDDIKLAFNDVSKAFEPLLGYINQALDWLLGTPAANAPEDSFAKGFGMGKTFGKIIGGILELIAAAIKKFTEFGESAGKRMAKFWLWIEEKYNKILVMLRKIGLIEKEVVDNANVMNDERFKLFSPEQIKQQSSAARRAREQQEKAAAAKKTSNTTNNINVTVSGTAAQKQVALNRAAGLAKGIASLTDHYARIGFGTALT